VRTKDLELDKDALFEELIEFVDELSVSPYEGNFKVVEINERDAFDEAAEANEAKRPSSVLHDMCIAINELDEEDELARALEEDDEDN